jgi:hypothetical protein
LTIGTDLIGGTGLLAGSAVIGVIVEIGADTIAERPCGGARAFAIIAELSTGAFSAALTAVLGMKLSISALAITVYLAFRA